MEIVAIVVVIVVVALIVGSLDNARPVSSWSDEKLQRMYSKLVRAATAAFNAGNQEAAKKHSQKADEVMREIQARRKNATTQSVEQLADALAPTIRNTAQKAAEAIQKTMAEHKEVPLANAAHAAALKQKISAVLQDARSFDVDQAVAALLTERASGKGWDAAIRTALPKLANFQLLQLRNNIAALTRSGKSERESIEIVLRSFLRPPA